MTDAPTPQPIPAPTQDDGEIDLQWLWRDITTTSGNGRLIQGLIRRCFAAERDRDADVAKWKEAAEIWAARTNAMSNGEEIYCARDMSKATEKARREQMERDCDVAQRHHGDPNVGHQDQGFAVCSVVDAIRAAFESQERTNNDV